MKCKSCGMTMAKGRGGSCCMMAKGRGGMTKAMARGGMCPPGAQPGTPFCPMGRAFGGIIGPALGDMVLPGMGFKRGGNIRPSLF